MWLKLTPSHLSLSSRTTFGEKAGTAHTLHFTVHLAGQTPCAGNGRGLAKPTHTPVRGDEQTQSTPI